MLSNVATIDQEATKISSRCKRGAIIPFDFEAAFSSVEQEFMIESIRWLGIAEGEINVITTLYDRKVAIIKIGGGTQEDRFA